MSRGKASQSPMADPASPRAVRDTSGQLGAWATSMASTATLALQQGKNRLAAALLRGASQLAELRADIEPLAAEESDAAEQRKLEGLKRGAASRREVRS